MCFLWFQSRADTAAAACIRGRNVRDQAAVLQLVDSASLFNSEQRPQEVISETTHRITSTLRPSKLSRRPVGRLSRFGKMSTVFCSCAKHAVTVQLQLPHMWRDNAHTHFTRFVWLEINFSRPCLGFHPRSFGVQQVAGFVFWGVVCSRSSIPGIWRTPDTLSGKCRWSCEQVCVCVCMSKWLTRDFMSAALTVFPD